MRDFYHDALFFHTLEVDGDLSNYSTTMYFWTNAHCL